ncbi:hypothetical protein B4U84_16860 [Westiellopsis prolifica IICB1]|nr:hypothetical protein B4U84_16860 [Westiellopsis prolifica IICB1]
MPNQPFVEEIKFQLFSKDSQKKDELVALFVAERPEISNTNQVYPVQSDPTGKTGKIINLKGVEELVNYFAPVLYFESEDEIKFPYDAKEIVLSPSYQKRSRTKDGKERKSRKGDSETYFDLAPPFPSSATGKVYASVLNNSKINELAINYYFFYPLSNWAAHGGYNTHQGDWEGITLFLKSDGKQWILNRAAYAQHLDPPKTIGLDRLRFFKNSNHPEVYVGLGGHASYPNPDETNWTTLPDRKLEIPNTRRSESHRGTNLWQSQGHVEYLPRVSNSLNTKHSWLLYSGCWGLPDLDGDGSGIDGDAAPRGPAFLEVTLTGRGDGNVGLRWLDPWKWAS